MAETAFDSSGAMVSIDPDAVHDLAGALDTIARSASDLTIDVAVATTRSGLWSPAGSRLDEVDDELTMLASILTDRALLASGFRLSLDNPHTAQLALWESITDGVGADAPIAGDIALRLILDHGADTDGNGFATIDELEAAAVDPTTPRSVREAIQAIVGDHDLIGRIITNDDGNQPFTPGIHLAAVEQWLVENEEMRAEIESAESIDPSMQIDAINRRIFAHDPPGARAFLAMLDNPATTGVAIPLGAATTPATLDLYAAAMTGISPREVAARVTIVSQLPETIDATRNQLITETYALVGISIDQIVNGDAAGQFDATGHSGNNWPLVGAAASGTIGELLRGEAPPTVGGVSLPAPAAANQLAADANQVIFTDVLISYAIFVDTFADGVVDAERVESFLSIFGDGQGDLRTGFALQIAAMQSTDPAERQRLQLEANVMISAHEQAVADPFLQLDPVLDSYPLGPTDAIAEPIAEAVFTSNAELRVPRADGTVWVIDLDQPLPPTSDPNNLVADVDLTDESNPDALTLDDVDLPGLDRLPDLSGTEAEHGVSIDVDDWVLEQHQGAFNVWQNYGDRMPTIAGLFQLHHSNPAFHEAATIILGTP